MVTTEPLLGARVPDQADGPLGGLQIGNAVRDLAPFGVARFADASTRDTKYAAWVASGGVMKDGMLCYLDSDDQFYARIQGVWRVSGAGTYRFYDEGSGTNTTLTTTAAAPTGGGASVTVPAGTFDVDLWAHFGLDVSGVGRNITAHVYSGSTEVWTTGFVVETTGLSSRDVSGMKRVTVAAGALSLRFSASATGGTQFVGENHIRAVRVG